MRSGRVVGVDIARCLALVGMMATHILPGVVHGSVTVPQQLAGGRASAMFAVLAGVSLVLVAGDRAPLRGRGWWVFFVGVAVRALLIGAIGLLLGELASGIAVILVYYAVLFVLAAPFLRLTTRAVAVWAGAWILLAPVVSHLLRARLPRTSYAVPSPASLEQPLTLARELLVTGYYPALTWLAYLLVGVVVGRLDLGAVRTSLWLAGVGAAGMLTAWSVSDALVGRPGIQDELFRTFTGAGRLPDFDQTLVRGLYGTAPTGSGWWLAVRTPHTGTTFDLLMTIGSALLVLAACLMVGRLAPRALAVAFGAGAMTLSLYTLHVVLRARGLWDGDDPATFVGQAAVVLVIGAGFRLADRRGPLEAVVGDLSSRARGLVPGRPAVRG